MSDLIELRSISKAFGGSLAVDDISLSLRGGSIHALMGENGAGKSTLMKILAGVHRPDHGEIYRNGQRLSFTTPRQALDHGISTVFQELSLLPNLTIAENMFLGREPLTALGRPDYPKMHAATARALADLELRLAPDMLVSRLTIAERQFVEIAHGIKADASVFILDEPTAALNAADVGILNQQLRKLRDAGKAIVYISHRMDEVFAICDTVSVLKDGKHIATLPITEVSPERLITLMVGRELQNLYPKRGNPISASAQPLLEVTELQLAPGKPPISLRLYPGEIVALAGLEGQGQQALLRALIGRFPAISGQITLAGKTLSLPRPPARGLREAQANGMAFVPEDRKEEGLFLDLPIAHNISIGPFSRKSALNIAREQAGQVAALMQKLAIRALNPRAAVGALSGGNQQKVLLARALALNAKVLLIEEPTRGVDIGAKAEIYQILRDFANAGGAILVLSRETIELIGLCDRILVVHGETIQAELAAEEASEHAILNAALSA